jgi:hypothetical protein
MSIRWIRHRQTSRWLTIGIAIAALALFAIPTQALTGSTFEIEGNLVVDTGGNTDWANAPNLRTRDDLPSGGSDDSFKASSEDTAVPQIDTGSIPNQKSDLTRFYVSNEHVGTTDFLYLSWQRANDLGTANMGFELNQSTTISANGVTPVRTANDILITFDWDSGGNVVDLGLLRWVTTGDVAQCEANGSLPCWGNRVDLTTSGDADGAVNATSSVLDPISGDTILERRFGEAAVNLNASGILPPGSCTGFASTYLKSRSSSAFNSELKDFIRPRSTPISNCGSVTIHKQNDIGQPLQGATFTLYDDVAPLDGPAPHGIEDTPHTNPTLSCTTNASGNCTISSVPLGQYWVVETVTPPNHFPANDVNINITTGDQVVALTLIDPRRPGTINIHKQDDKGAPLLGAEFTLYTDNAPLDGAAPHGAEDTATALKCTTNASGNCTIANVPLGQYWVVESKTPAGYATAADKNVILNTGGQTVNLTFTNPRLFIVITVVCKQSTNGLYASSVTLDGQQKTSLGPGGGGSLTDAQICGLGGARFPNRAKGNHTGSVNIPK